MTASDCLDHLSTQGLARPRPGRSGITSAVAVGSIEVAEAERSSDTFMRARWRERVAGTATPYLVIADDPESPDRVRVLGPASGKRPIVSVSPELLADSLQRVAPLSAFDAVRRLGNELTRIAGDGLTVHGLLTRHTLEHRFRGDAARWGAAKASILGIKYPCQAEAVFLCRDLP